MYNPKKAPHMLEGNKSVPDFVMTPVNKTRFADTNPNPAISRSESPSFSPIRTPAEDYDVNLKRAWQSVLRECQRNDPERTGLVSRNTFVNALESNTNGVSLFCIVFILHVLCLFPLYCSQCHPVRLVNWRTSILMQTAADWLIMSLVSAIS